MPLNAVRYARKRRGALRWLARSWLVVGDLPTAMSEVWMRTEDGGSVAVSAGRCVVVARVCCEGEITQKATSKMQNQVH